MKTGTISPPRIGTCLYCGQKKELSFYEDGGADVGYRVFCDDLCYRREQAINLSERILQITSALSAHEPPPKPSDHPAVWDLVLKDIQERDRYGLEKYGQRLKPHDGRKNLIDAYQEALDLVVYLRKEIYEREGR